MKQILHIIRYKVISFFRADSKLTLGSAIKSTAGSIIYLAFAAGCYFFIQKFIRFLLIDIGVGLFLLHQLMSIIFYILLISINIGNIIVSYSTLYKSGEVTYLLSKPVLPGKIFAIKFLDNFFYSSSTLLLIILSLIAGYIHYFNLGPAAIALLFLNSLAFMLNAASLGVLLLLILMLLANRFGLKKILYILISGYILSILLFFEINSPRILVTTVMKYYPSVSKDLYLEGLVPGFTKFLPSEWLAQSGYWLVRGNFYNSLLYSALQFLLMFLLCGTVFYAGQRWYMKTWLLNLKIELMSFVRSKKRIPFLSFDTKTLFSPRRDALLKREILLFVREPSQILHLIVLLFLIAVFIISVAGIKFVGIGNFYLQTMIYFSIFIFNLLFISTLSLRFVFPLISLEGEAYWKVRSAPVKPKELLIDKILIYSVIILLLSIGLSYFSNFNFGKELTFFAVAITFFAGMAIIAINLGMGGLHANFREKNPIRLSSSQGASLSFLVNIVFMLFLIIILFKPLSQMFLSIMIKRPISLSLLYGTLIPVIVTSSLLIIIFIKIALNSLKNDI